MAYYDSRMSVINTAAIAALADQRMHVSYFGFDILSIAVCRTLHLGKLIFKRGQLWLDVQEEASSRFSLLSACTRSVMVAVWMWCPEKLVAYRMGKTMWRWVLRQQATDTTLKVLERNLALILSGVNKGKGEQAVQDSDVQALSLSWLPKDADISRICEHDWHELIGACKVFSFPARILRLTFPMVAQPLHRKTRSFQTCYSGPKIRAVKGRAKQLLGKAARFGLESDAEQTFVRRASTRETEAIGGRQCKNQANFPVRCRDPDLQ